MPWEASRSVAHDMMLSMKLLPVAFVFGHGRVAEKPVRFTVKQGAKSAVPALNQRTLGDCAHGRDRLNGRNGRRSRLRDRRDTRGPYQQCTTGNFGKPIHEPYCKTILR